MWFPFTLLGLAAQVPLQTPPGPKQLDPVGNASIMRNINPNFKLKEGPDVFSPKDLVELPRPGTGLANEIGDLVLIPVSKYSFKDKKNYQSITVAPIEPTVKPLEIPLTEGGQALWLNDRTVAHVVKGKSEKTQDVYAISLKVETESPHITAPSSPVYIGTIPVSTAGNFRYWRHTTTLVFSAYVYEDGDLTKANEKDEEWEKRGTTALLYDETYERHWDAWTGPKRQSLFTVQLGRREDGTWFLGDEYRNLLQGTGHSTPVEPFGGTDDFDVWENFIVYTTKDPELPQAWHTRQNVYLVDKTGLTPPRHLTSGKQGATHSPIFNRQGTQVAWLELDQDGYESDRAKVVLYDLAKNIRLTLTPKWDRSPDSIAFSRDGKHLVLTAGDEAKIKLFVLPLAPIPANTESSTDPDLPSVYTTPVPVTETGSVGGINVLYSGDVIFTRSTLQGPNDVWIAKHLNQFVDSLLSNSKTVVKPVIERITDFTSDQLKGKDLSPGEEFWFEGAKGKKVQGWLLKPSGFKKGDKKKWPVVLLIHGGPQGAWEDQWSTRWNPNVFAQQAYVTVAINPTGSTTFGQEFTDAIAEDWGGKPFVDMRKGWKYILDKYPEIDPERAVAAGASWGGYAINWIQSNPEFGFGFKALVCHDGVFDTHYNGFSTDELFFFNHDFGGRPWENKTKAISEKFSPANFVHKWSTPQLLIHSSKDYRLPETEGIGAFHALKELGIPTRLLIFPDENHWVLNHGNSLKWHYEVFRWFDEFVGKKD